MLGLMAIFFGHRTAAYLLSSALAPEFRPTAETPAECGFVDLEALNSVSLDGFGLPEGEPIDLVVGSRDSRRPRKGMRMHMSSGRLPHGAYLEIAPDVFVASPALCLVQMSPVLTFAGRVRLCASFCGTYAPSSLDPRGFITREPLARPDDIRAFSELCMGVRGRRLALDAAAWTLPNAASPMETKMVMPLYLPAKLGGFGLPKPTMNYGFTLSSRAAALVNKSWVMVDAFWPDADFGLEYQSEMFHHGDERYGQDIGRQLAIETMGKTILMVTLEQLRNPAQLERIAQITALHIGVAFDPEAGRERREELIHDVLSGRVVHSA